MTRRVLIVTGSYSPTMIADMHRARHLAWELPKAGWEVEILVPNSNYQPPSCLDDDSAAFFPPNISTHSVQEICPNLFRAVRARGIGWRAIVPMLRAGRELLKDRRFDLIYISTAQFPLFLLGPAWKRRFGIPFVLDFHDLCFNSSRPVWAPAGLKHAINRLLAKYVELRSATAAAGLVSVSPDYVETLRRRYERKRPPWLAKARSAVIPFGVLPHDFELAAGSMTTRRKDAARPARVVYVGAGGPIMQRSFSLLCRALSDLRIQDPDLVEGIRIELYGTILGWRDGETRHLEDLARKWTIADLVSENPGRVSYRRSLELLLESDGALILGVDDDGYMPSKLFSYALSAKPLLASLHRNGPAFAQFQTTPSLGHALWFDTTNEMTMVDAANALRAFLSEVIARRSFDRRNVLEPYLAPAMARRHSNLFEACLSAPASSAARLETDRTIRGRSRHRTYS